MPSMQLLKRRATSYIRLQRNTQGNRTNELPICRHILKRSRRTLQRCEWTASNCRRKRKTTRPYQTRDTRCINKVLFKLWKSRVSFLSRRLFTQFLDIRGSRCKDVGIGHLRLSLEPEPDIVKWAGTSNTIYISKPIPDFHCILSIIQYMYLVHKMQQPLSSTVNW